MFRRTIVSAAVLLSFAPLAAQEKDARDTTSTPHAKAEVLWHEVKVLIPTRVIFPPEFDAKRAHTLIVALHGIGGSAEAFQRTVGEFADMGFIVALPEAAYPMLVNGKLGYDWTLIQQPDRTLTQRATNLAGLDQIPPVVTDLRRRYRIDRVYLLGFSQGALLALWTGISNSELFDGVVSFGPPAFDTAWFPGNTVAESSGVRVLLAHSQEDEHARFSVSKDALDSLKDAGYDVTLRPFVGGHTVPSDQLNFVAKWIRKVNP